MKSLKEKIKEDLIKAIKEKEEKVSLTLRGVLASTQLKEKEKRYNFSKEDSNLTEEELLEKSSLTEEELIGIIFSEAKKRKEAIFEYEKGKREDLVKKEKEELAILEKYLPEQLSEEELKKIIEEAVVSQGKEIGKIMAEVMPKVKGKAEGSQVSRLVKEALSSL